MYYPMDDSMYGGGSATDEGLMEYTPSASNSQKHGSSSANRNHIAMLAPEG